MSTSQSVVEIITVGREILDGRVIDTNSNYLGEVLNKIGLCPRFAQRVDDDSNRIIEAFRTASLRAQIILVTGGLGPTSDDITLENFAKFVDQPLEYNTEALAQIETRFKLINRPFTEVQKKQALFPREGVPIENKWGTAPGMFFRQGHQMWFFMPGVPKEMKGIFSETVIEKLIPFSQPTRNWTWKTQFTSEGELQNRLKPFIDLSIKNNFEFTFRTRFPENHLGLSASNLGVERARVFEKIISEVSALLGPDCFAEGENPSQLEEVFFESIKKHDLDIVFVESCTGGLLTHRLTKIPGVSSHFWGSFICYDNSAKFNLGVRDQVLENEGAVSEVCARELAINGIRQKVEKKAKATLCISTTGIAGPTGATADKPVGLCFLAVALCDSQGKIVKEETREIQARVGLGREENMLFFTQKALAFGLEFTRRNMSP